MINFFLHIFPPLDPNHQLSSSTTPQTHKHAVQSHAHKERPTICCHVVTIGRQTIENHIRPTQPQELRPSLSHKHLYVSVPPLFPPASFQLIAYSCQRWKTPELQPSWWNYSTDTYSTKVMWSLLSEAGEDSLCQSFCVILLFTCFFFFICSAIFSYFLLPFFSDFRHLSVSAGVYATNVCLYLNHTTSSDLLSFLLPFKDEMNAASRNRAIASRTQSTSAQN